jgi:hypothetical protein
MKEPMVTKALENRLFWFFENRVKSA